MVGKPMRQGYQDIDHMQDGQVGHHQTNLKKRRVVGPNLMYLATLRGGPITEAWYEMMMTEPAVRDAVDMAVERNRGLPMNLRYPIYNSNAAYAGLGPMKYDGRMQMYPLHSHSRPEIPQGIHQHWIGQGQADTTQRQTYNSREKKRTNGWIVIIKFRNKPQALSFTR